jgi:uncharacterized protein
MSDVEKGQQPEHIDTNSGPSGQPLWDPSHAYAPRRPSRIGNPGALYDHSLLIRYCWLNTM